MNAKKPPINITRFLDILREEIQTYTVPVVDLINTQTRSPFKVLVATILSARTKDEVTAKASERLFSKADTVDRLRQLSIDEIRELIFPVGFYKLKAGYLSKLPDVLDRFDKRVPDAIEELITLPGVGRKTANLVRSVAFDKDAICVDTHVHRITNIWKYVRTQTPLETEQALRRKLPREHWKEINAILVAFGQGTCRPVSPLCYQCPLEPACPQYKVTPRKKKA